MSKKIQLNTKLHQSVTNFLYKSNKIGFKIITILIETLFNISKKPIITTAINNNDQLSAKTKNSANPNKKSLSNIP